MSQLLFSQALDVRPGITSVIGSGGKTTLLRTLASELSALAPVLLTTTTHFLPFPEYPLIDTACMEQDNVFGAEAEAALLARVLRESEALLAKGHRVVVLGSHMTPIRRSFPNIKDPAGQNRPPEMKLTMPALSDFHPLLQIFPYILVEADGSRRLPLKAHAGHEPVIPPGSQKSILLVGASGIGKPLDAVCHRPERYREILTALDLPLPHQASQGRPERHPAIPPRSTAQTESSPTALGQVLNREALADCIFLNQLDPQPAAVGTVCIQDTVSEKNWHFTEAQLAVARELQMVSRVPVFFGSLQKRCCCR